MYYKYVEHMNDVYADIRRIVYDIYLINDNIIIYECNFINTITVLLF